MESVTPQTWELIGWSAVALVTALVMGMLMRLVVPAHYYPRTVSTIVAIFWCALLQPEGLNWMGEAILLAIIVIVLGNPRDLARDKAARRAYLAGGQSPNAPQPQDE